VARGLGVGRVQDWVFDDHCHDGFVTSSPSQDQE
jgi:hypothetical protein